MRYNLCTLRSAEKCMNPFKYCIMQEIFENVSPCLEFLSIIAIYYLSHCIELGDEL